MKHWCLTFCLVIVALFGSINPALSETRKFSSDLPTCQGSPIKRDDDYIRLKWTNCYGVVKYPFMMAALRFPTKEGVYVTGRLVKGYDTYNNWIDKTAVLKQQGSSSKSNTLIKPSPLKSAFIKLPKEQRKVLQSNLKNLGYYDSTIDGLYGRGTSGALTAYNKRSLHNSRFPRATKFCMH